MIINRDYYLCVVMCIGLLRFNQTDLVVPLEYLLRERVGEAALEVVATPRADAAAVYDDAHVESASNAPHPPGDIHSATGRRRSPLLAPASLVYPRARAATTTAALEAHLRVLSVCACENRGARRDSGARNDKIMVPCVPTRCLVLRV